MSVFKKHKIILGLVTVLSLSLLAYWYLKQPYQYPEAQQITRQFMQLLRDQNYEQAFSLMAQPNLSADSPKVLAERAQAECLDDEVFAYASPPQANGNRLRRWLKQETVDQTKITLDFEHSCLLGVQLVKTKQGEWRILRFGGHAG
ncbi:MAG: hypothetical protein E6Q83_13640 [Thiothrix sp.]|nr:MAG: hypothetical protein E6Q83_13640 [Thiothrix sp.]